ncbi:protein ovarian tumor locus-like isoform X3 [Helicoverpa armigera]|uniref:protein ovarian tumor locus-like isoform X3 n=1 Tax=Helicoverpa armigera TaxID=29058 RepID=UPI00308311EB
MSPSPIRCRGPWKIHKRSSEPDRWLDEMGFFRKHTARDSSCLFRAVSENIYNTQRYFHKVRLDCVQFMATKRHLFEGSLTCPFENYLKEMSNPSEWGGLIEISAMSHLYRRDFVIFEANKGPQTKICNGYGDPIYLFYSPDTKHFDVVYTKDFINTSSFCQSLVYEILYDGVYQLKDLSYAVDKMLHDKVPTNHIEYFMTENVERRKKQKERAKIFIEAADDDKDRNTNALALKCKHHTEDLERASLLKESLSIFVFNRSLIQLENVCMNCLNVNSAKDLLDNGITPFPYKVAKALDPDIYRNIEFDVWSELRREMRYGARYSDGTTLQVGVKCLCKLQPEQTVPYHCHIQEMRPDGGPCLVFIEELGEKRVVNFEQLEPLPLEEIRPWAPPYRYSRAHSQFLTLSQMLQQIGSTCIIKLFSYSSSKCLLLLIKKLRKQILVLSTILLLHTLYNLAYSIGISRPGNITLKQGLSKARNKSKVVSEDKAPEKVTKPTKVSWNEDTELSFQNNVDFTYQHLDFLNFEPMPVEVEALPLMVDCRPGAGAPPHELAHTQPNGGTPNDNHHTQQAGGSGDMVAHGITSPASVRASTPATTNTLTTYTNAVNPVGGVGPGYGGGYVCGVKGVVWAPPPAAPHPPHLPPPPPPGVNPHVFKSVQANGADLPMNDITTLRYYYNLGVDCFWSSYGAPPPPPPPPRHYSPRELAQDMASVTLHERPPPDHKHKQPDKPPLPQGKGNAQRPLLGPRFKRGGGNQDGNQNSNHNQNKHNNNMGNKGPNNRRNSHTEQRGPHAYGAGEGECVLDQPLLTLPYIPYPPPIYPIQYYPVETDPAMMGMMGGMGYVGYEESVYEGGMQPYYPHAPHYPPPHPHPHPHHIEHK